MIEVKYSPDNDDTEHFFSIAKLYGMKKKPYEHLIMIALEIKQNHLNYVEERGIGVISGKII